MKTNLHPLLLVAAGSGLALLTGCRQDMHDQPSYKPYAQSSFWPDQRSARPAIDGAVARGKLKTDTRLWKGRAADGTFITEIPMPVTKALLMRGQQRFNIYCTPCHGRTGKRLRRRRRGVPDPGSAPGGVVGGVRCRSEERV